MQKLFDKKGELSWDSLLGITLAVAGLVMLISFFSSIFLSTPSNQQVSEQAINSFGGFIELSNKDVYNGLDNCYTNFRIENLASFQKDDNLKYFYVITNEYVGMVNFENYEEFSTQENANFDVVQEKYEFDENIELRLDETSEGWKLIKDNTFGFLGRADSQLKFANDNLNYILLFPEFSNQNKYEVIIPGFEKERVVQTGKLPGRKTNPDNVKKSYDEIPYLAFNPQDNFLFAPRNKMSQSIVNANSCLDRKREVELIKNIGVNDIYNLDYKNKRIKFEIKPKAEYSFEWTEKAICKKQGQSVSCDKVLDKSSFKYEEFIDSIQNYIRTLEGDVSLGVSEYKSIEEVYSQDSFDSELFSISDEITYNSQGDIKDEYSSSYYLDDGWGNYNVDIVYENNQIYYQMDKIDENRFVSFNENYLNSLKVGNNQYNYYFNNKRLDDFEIRENLEDVKPYYTTINIDNEEYYVYLSQEQMQNLNDEALEIENTFIENDKIKLDEYFVSNIGDSGGSSYISEKYEDEVFIKRNIDNSKFKNVQAQNSYFYDENKIWSLIRFNGLGFMRFNESFVDVIENFEEQKKYYYFNEEIEFQEKKLYSKETDINVHCFSLPFQDFFDKNEFSIRVQEVCISQEQYENINGGEQNE